MSTQADTLLKDLETLYRELPPVPCLACGECCVSPTITLLEFVYLWDGACKEFTADSLKAMLLEPARISDKFEGNLVCKFLSNKGQCSLHTYRTMACRLHGMPVLEKMNIENQEICKKILLANQKDVSLPQLRIWLDRLSALNAQIMDYYTEPYFLAGLNVESWLAVLFDPLLDGGPFGQAKQILRKRYPETLSIPCIDKTGLKEKADKIALLYELMAWGVAPELLTLLESIEKDYPLTGTYFLKEAANIKSIISSRLK